MKLVCADCEETIRVGNEINTNLKIQCLDCFLKELEQQSKTIQNEFTQAGL